MESIIIFTGSSFIFFFILALFSKGLSFSLPQSRVLRSLGRTPQKDNESGNTAKPSNKENSSNSLHKFLNSFTKNEKSIGKKDQELTAAGLKNWSSSEWKVLNTVAALCFALIVIAIIFFFHFSAAAKIEIILIGFLLGYLSPNIWLKSKIKQRQEEILRTLPDILDLIMVSVEAGLGFDAAMMKVVEKQKGVLAEELTIVLQEIKIGKPRRDALKDMARKNNVEDLSNVIASLVQADQLGISMGSVLRNQASQIRQKRKQRAQEKAQKAPVKIMIPLVFFIFPSIFIIILGPAVIKILDIFGK